MTTYIDEWGFEQKTLWAHYVPIHFFAGTSRERWHHGDQKAVFHTREEAEESARLESERVGETMAVFEVDQDGYPMRHRA